MSPLLGNILVGAVVLILSALSARSLWKSHRPGGTCNGDCSHCSSCHHK